MKIFQQFSSIFRKTSPEKERSRDLLLKKFRSFQDLLSQNNLVLELMADMEAKLSGEFLIDRSYIESSITAISKGVKNIIEKLNETSEKRYKGLSDRFNIIHSEVETFLSRGKQVPVSSYTFPFDEITKEMIDRLGGKNANLGEVRNRLRIPTPDGFAISAFAFKSFMEHNKILEQINKILFELKVDNLEELNNKSKEIQEQVIKAEIPKDLEQEIQDAYLKLSDRCGKKVSVSVRSSALQEDGTFSFAGQYATFLNVPSDLILQKYKEVIASLFTPRAIFYYKTKGLHEHEMVMSVGVLTMIDAKAAGVIYSRDPNNPKADTLIVSAARGLGKSVVDGVETPETYIVSRYSTDNPPISLSFKSPHPPFSKEGPGGFEIISKNIPEQKSMYICRPDGEIEEVTLTDEMKGTQSLNDEQIKALAEYAIALENHYKSPQDIEWAIDRDDRPYILQTRPLIIMNEKARPVPTHIEGYNILIDRGVIACKGIGFGKAFIIRKEEDLKEFPDGAVLVSKHTSTKFVTVMNKAKAIITDVGGAAGHMASLAREFGIPTILDTEIATNIIQEDQELTVDAINCNIYEGYVKELKEFAEKREEPFKSTMIFQTLEKVLKWVVPLNLVDPDDKRFKPESCETLHDITRFCHEMVMREMFKITEITSQEVCGSPKLEAPIPMEVYLIDLDGGIKGAPKKITPEYIDSSPFNAFYSGLASMKWPEPRPFDVT